MSSGLVGVCEDDPELREILVTALGRAGYRVRATATGAAALSAFVETAPDALVLDIGLPDADGRDVCQALRARGLAFAVLFLTARDALPDRLSGFHAGGDDYLTKPFSIAELLVRIEALLRRAAPAEPVPVEALVLDPAGHAITGSPPVPLTPTEFRIVGALAARRGQVVRRAELVRAAWPDGAIVHDNTLDAYVSRLRAKLRAAGRPERIENVRGVGYVLR